MNLEPSVAQFVGASATLKVEVTARDTMNYAAGVEDLNSAYFDDTTPAGLVAPPMFAAALTWRLSSRLPELWPDFPISADALLSQVHYSERLRWERCVKPGDRLGITGQITGLHPHRAGTLLWIEYTVRDASGGLVFTEEAGSLLRGAFLTETSETPAVEVKGEAAPQESMWRKRLSIAPHAAHLYDACANIHFPIHTSPGFAQSQGLPGTIYQGTATLAVALREIINQEAQGNVSSVREVACRFTGMVRPGTDIQLEVVRRTETEEGTEVNFVVWNHENTLAIRQGRVRIRS